MAEHADIGVVGGGDVLGPGPPELVAGANVDADALDGDRDRLREPRVPRDVAVAEDRLGCGRIGRLRTVRIRAGCAESREPCFAK